MPLDELVRLIQAEAPTDTSIFFPNFEFTKNSQHAFFAAFCDLCSPYYEYGMYLCGFSSIKIKGTIEDWKLLKEHWIRARDILQTSNAAHIKWKQDVSNVLNSILSHFNDANFWNQIFSLKKCGSGHQTTASGWLLDLYISQPVVKYVQNYASHISCVTYSNLQTEQHYEMNVGLFNSEPIDGFMEPSFSSIIYNMTDYVKLMQETL
jgi:hypothetical protein